MHAQDPAGTTAADQGPGDRMPANPPDKDRMNQPLPLVLPAHSATGPLARTLQKLRIQILPETFAVIFGMVMLLCLRGYQFGHSNHNVYLIDGLFRASDHKLLANDWFTTQTFQYHAFFGIFTEQLMRWNLLEPAFLIGYIALAFLMNLAWYRLVLLLGGTRMTYLISLLLFYISAAGVGLGVFEFMQDSSFLPSNIANVAMLWGIYLFIARKWVWAGLWMALAGIFHLHHAIVGGGLWSAMLFWMMLDSRRETGSFLRPLGDRRLLIGTALALIPGSLNTGIAFLGAMHQTSSMPLDHFVELFCRMRHPHHYYPASWPAALWIVFFWAFPLTWWAWKIRPRLKLSSLRSTLAPPQHVVDQAWIQATRIFILLTIAIVIAIVFAGIIFINQSLIQLSLFRFGIYLKLFSSIGAAWLLYNSGLVTRKTVRIGLFGFVGVLVLILSGLAIVSVFNPVAWKSLTWLAGYVMDHRGSIGLFIILCAILAIYELIYARHLRWGQDLLHAGGALALLVVIYFSWGRWLGVNSLPDDDAAYLQVCHFVKTQTPVDAVFMVPPDEQSFRVHGERAIVVNIKGIPQLSGEMVDWELRLRDILDLQKIETLRGTTLQDTLNAVRMAYDAVPADHMLTMARKYNCRYVLLTHPWDSGPITPYDEQWLRARSISTNDTINHDLENFAPALELQAPQPTDKPHAPRLVLHTNPQLTIQYFLYDVGSSGQNE